MMQTLSPSGEAQTVRSKSLGWGSRRIVSESNAAVAPSVSSAGERILCVEDGALKYKGSNGTVTAIAPA
jgi:hypothetical protein